MSIFTLVFETPAPLSRHSMNADERRFLRLV